MGVVRAQPTEWVNSTIYTVKLGHFHVRTSDIRIMKSKIVDSQSVNLVLRVTKLIHS